MATEIKAKSPSKSKHGMKLHTFVATGGKPSEFQGSQGTPQTVKTDAEQVGSELNEKKPQ